MSEFNIKKVKGNIEEAYIYVEFEREGRKGSFIYNLTGENVGIQRLKYDGENTKDIYKDIYKYISDSLAINLDITFKDGKKEKKCEACEKAPQTNILKENPDLFTDTKKDYRICSNCLFDLINLSLTKEQYRNLLENGHNRSEFYLHDDFYDDEGNVLQPKKDTQVNFELVEDVLYEAEKEELINYILDYVPKSNLKKLYE